MNQYMNALCVLLQADNWKEPTKEKYLTYLEAYKRHGRDAKAPYFEDIHYAWRNYKPNGA